MNFLRIALVFVGVSALGCTSSMEETATGATCDSSVSALTYDAFGHDFMAEYCTGCHASDRKGHDRHGAPDDDNFDSLDGIRASARDIDATAGSGPHGTFQVMPPSRCASCKLPTVEERTQLASWLACEIKTMR